jgi:hypothetical protein
VCHCICAEGQIQRSLKVGMSVEDPPVIVTTVPLLYDNGFKLAWAAMGFCEEPCNCTGRHHQCATQRDVDARGSRWYAFPEFDQQLPHLYPSNCSEDNASNCNCSCPQGFVPHPAPGYDEMEYAVPRPWKWFCLDRNECGGGFHSTSPAFHWWPQFEADLPENGQPQHNCHKNATCRNTPGSVLRPEMQSSTFSREVSETDLRMRYLAGRFSASAWKVSTGMEPTATARPATAHIAQASMTSDAMIMVFAGLRWRVTVGSSNSLILVDLCDRHTALMQTKVAASASVLRAST